MELDEFKIMLFKYPIRNILRWVKFCDLSSNHKFQLQSDFIFFCYVISFAGKIKVQKNFIWASNIFFIFLPFLDYWGGKELSVANGSKL